MKELFFYKDECFADDNNELYFIKNSKVYPVLYIPNYNDSRHSDNEVVVYCTDYEYLIKAHVVCCTYREKEYFNKTIARNLNMNNCVCYNSKFFKDNTDLFVGIPLYEIRNIFDFTSKNYVITKENTLMDLRDSKIYLVYKTTIWYYRNNKLNVIETKHNLRRYSDGYYWYDEPKFKKRLEKYSYSPLSMQKISNWLLECVGCDKEYVDKKIEGHIEKREANFKNKGNYIERKSQKKNLYEALSINVKNIIVGMDENVDMRPNDFSVNLICKGSSSKLDRTQIIKTNGKEIARYVCDMLKMGYRGRVFTDFGCYKVKFIIKNVPQIEVLFSVKDELIPEEE